MFVLLIAFDVFPDQIKMVTIMCWSRCPYFIIVILYLVAYLSFYHEKAINALYELT